MRRNWKKNALRCTGPPDVKDEACLEIMEKKDLEKEDVTGIETVLDTLPVKPAYQQKMLTRIISYYRAALFGDDEAMDAEVERTS